MPLKNDPSFVGVLLGYGGGLPYISMVVSTKNSTQTDSVDQISDYITVVSPQDIEKVLLKLFPCTSMDDWNNVFQGRDIKSLLPKLLPKLLPPQPCKSDNSLYCCAGKDAPLCFCKPCKKHHFFDMKTVAMICFILLLLLLLLYMIMSKDKSSGSSANSSR